MRIPSLLTAIVLASLLAGCSAKSTPEPTAAAPPAVSPTHILPPDIHENSTIGPSADPLASGGPSCTPPTSTCVRMPFHLEGNASLRAALHWPFPSDDLDLYIVLDGRVVAQSNDFAGSSESLHTHLEEGDYEVVVGGSATAGTSYQLDVWFTAERAPNP